MALWVCQLQSKFFFFLITNQFVMQAISIFIIQTLHIFNEGKLCCLHASVCKGWECRVCYIPHMKLCHMTIILSLKHLPELCPGPGCSSRDYTHSVNLTRWLFLSPVLNKGHMGFNFLQFYSHERFTCWGLNNHYGTLCRTV